MAKLQRQRPGAPSTAMMSISTLLLTVVPALAISVLSNLISDNNRALIWHEWQNALSAAAPDKYKPSSAPHSDSALVWSIEDLAGDVVYLLLLVIWHQWIERHFPNPRPARGSPRLEAQNDFRPRSWGNAFTKWTLTQVVSVALAIALIDLSQLVTGETTFEAGTTGMQYGARLSLVALRLVLPTAWVKIPVYTLVTAKHRETASQTIDCMKTLLFRGGLCFFPWLLRTTWGYFIIRIHIEAEKNLAKTEL